MVRRARRCLQLVWNVEWKRATFAWKECSSPYQPGRNVKAEYREVQHDLQNIRRYHIDVGPVGPRCMELPHDRLHGTYLQRLCSGPVAAPIPRPSAPPAIAHSSRRMLAVLGRTSGRRLLSSQRPNRFAKSPAASTLALPPTMNSRSVHIIQARSIRWRAEEDLVRSLCRSPY